MSRPLMLSMGFSYPEYLETDAWRAVREAAIERAGHRCEWCAGPGPFEVHHLNYENLGEPEEIDDVRALCRHCHAWTHDPRRGDGGFRRMVDHLPAALERIQGGCNNTPEAPKIAPCPASEGETGTETAPKPERPKMPKRYGLLSKGAHP